MTPNTIICGDCLEVLKTMPDESVNCCITSPPYWGLRSYLPDGVRPKTDCPDWVLKQLSEKNVFPVDHIID